MRLSLSLLSLVALAVTAQDTSVATVKQAFDDANVRPFTALHFRRSMTLSLMVDSRRPLYHL
jgi:hypothetical protein